MFASGVATFALLHNAQAVLPALSEAFGVSPAGASLTVSCATGALALGVIPISVLSERFGRVLVMTTAISLATLLGLVTPLCHTFPQLLLARGLQGLAVAGLPAVTIAYLGEEIHRDSLPGAVGTLIAGNAIGGLAGRLLAGAVADLVDWRAGMASVGVLALGCVVVFVALLPRQRNFRKAQIDLSGLLSGLGRHLANAQMLRLYAVACVLMGTFSTLYNYVGYRLVSPPFSLAPGVVGLVFLAYLAGTASSAVAGRLAERVGPRLVLVAGAAICMAAAVLTLPNSLAAILGGVLALTVGFFAAHSAASGWVGRLASTARAQASALYTLSYYVGASVGGWAGGLVYERKGWLGVVAYLQVLLALAIVTGVSSAPPAKRRRDGPAT